MARRFGGKYSPEAQEGDAAPRPPRPEIDPAGARVNLLFLPPVVLVVTSLTNGALGLVTGLGAAAILTFAALLLRDGLRAEAAYHARRAARAPAIPRKLFAGALTGIGIAFAAYRNQIGVPDAGAGADSGALLAPLLYGIAAAGLHVAAFGADPMRDKGMEDVDTFQQDRVARAVTEAEQHLAAMRTAIARAGDRRLEARVERFAATARSLFRTLEDDPRDLTGARRYLGVYLMGARDASDKFADVYSRSRDAGARADYEALLDDLERNFTARTQKMLSNDHSDLTVEIEVLRDRLKREGVRLDTH